VRTEPTDTGFCVYDGEGQAVARVTGVWTQEHVCYNARSKANEYKRTPCNPNGIRIMLCRPVTVAELAALAELGPTFKA